MNFVLDLDSNPHPALKIFAKDAMARGGDYWASCLGTMLAATGGSEEELIAWVERS